MKIIIEVIKFNILSLLRNFKSSGIMFILPVVFMGIFALAFGGNSSVMKFSSGTFVDNSVSTMAPDYNSILNEIKKSNSLIDITSQKYSDLNDLKADVKVKKVDTGIIVTANTSSQTIPFKIELLFNEQSNFNQQAQSIVQSVVYSSLAGFSIPVQTTYLNPMTQVVTSAFDILVPGLIIYGLLILIPGIAQSFTSLTEKNYIFRLANSRANSFHIISGNVVYYLILSLVQIFLLYGTAIAFGYKANGNVVLALVPGILAGFFVIGLGLLIGAFVKKTDAATNIGTIVSIILGFFSGSFIYGIGQVLEFNFLGNKVQFNDFLPTKWGTVAMEKILSKNMTLTDIPTELLILGLSGVALLIIGVIIYQRRQLSVQN